MTELKNVEINRELAAKVLEIVDHGLTQGLGKQKNGELCVEAAVCYAMGLPHGDEPPCVSIAIRKLKIRLNDSNWSSNTERAKGMRRLAIAQLGTAGKIDDVDFSKRVVIMLIQKVLPRALRNAAKLSKQHEHKEKLEIAAKDCEEVKNLAEAKIAANKAKTYAAAYAYAAAADAADAAAYAADAAYAYAADAAVYAAAAAADAADAAAYADADAAYARDKELSFFAEEVVKILIDMKAEGTHWLDLTEAA